MGVHRACRRASETELTATHGWLNGTCKVRAHRNGGVDVCRVRARLFLCCKLAATAVVRSSVVWRLQARGVFNGGWLACVAAWLLCSEAVPLRLPSVVAAALSQPQQTFSHALPLAWAFPMHGNVMAAAARLQHQPERWHDHSVFRPPMELMAEVETADLGDMDPSDDDSDGD